VVAVAVATAAGTSMVAANAKPSLPDKTAAQLLVEAQGAKVDGLSGTVVLKTDLGLPDLPSIGGRGSANLTSLISGAHTLRVWSAGEDKQRLALLGTLGESDVIHNGKDVWLWSSDENKASHYTLPAGAAKVHDVPKQLPADLPKTPQEAAEKALAAIDPSTKVTTDGSASVAGRDAYELVLQPRDAKSKVTEVRLAVDAKTKIPLRVRVFGSDQANPAIEVGFTQISMNKPGDENFRFTPPPGVTVQESKAKVPDEKDATDAKDAPGKRGPGKVADAGGPTVIGTGWTSVVVIKGAATPTQEEKAGGASDQLNAIAGALPRVSGSWGSGRLLNSKLFSVLLTDDGRILAGAVSKDALLAAASDPAAKAPR
jgi:outer membrane lipoprotein-sorting protein